MAIARPLTKQPAQKINRRGVAQHRFSKTKNLRAMDFVRVVLSVVQPQALTLHGLLCHGVQFDSSPNVKLLARFVNRYFVNKIIMTTVCEFHQSARFVNLYSTSNSMEPLSTILFIKYKFNLNVYRQPLLYTDPSVACSILTEVEGEVESVSLFHCDVWHAK